jgi:plasmid stability protein
MRNVTITLDDEVARWARIWAAEHETSVSRMLGEMLRERMLRERSYEQAMERYLSAGGFHLGGGPYPSREELYGDRLR